jgi:ParB family chromosome partitioning protein
MSTPSLIPLTQLDKSDLNVRTSFDKGAMQELQASILAHGLMQNLVVVKSKGNRYNVIAGGRRLAAMQALQKGGKLPKDHTVPCQIADEGKASELSLAENTVREEMHPADEFEAFAALSKQHNAADIAKRFGVTEKHVHQRMRLARVAPELMKTYRAGDLNLDAMMAFTLSDDHNHQRKVFKAAGKNPQAHYVRRLMTEKSESSKGKLCKFVTLKAYVDAGGKIREDLFGNETFLENPELLHQLANDKLAAIAAKLKAEGWGWVETAFESDYMFISRYGRIDPKPTDAPKKLTDKLGKLQADYDKVDDACSDADYEDDDLEAKRDELQGQLDELEAQLRELQQIRFRANEVGRRLRPAGL